MTTELASDEVAEDYKNSLEDLTLNSRYEISNLTVIAKENVDHALAISRVVENHIRNVSTNPCHPPGPTKSSRLSWLSPRLFLYARG